MKRSLHITRNPIRESALIAERTMTSEAGAVVIFLGMVRETEGSERITAIDYEAHETMARHQFEKLFDALESEWQIESIRLIHRIGSVATKEPSLWIEMISTHRQEAFEACQWLIEEMKKKVPIWKHPKK